MKQRNSFSILCFIIISFGVASVSAQQCMNNGNFRPNSSYDANRSLLLSLLPTSVKDQDGFFYNDSMGQEPNRVYAIGMCIPGSTPDDCYVCIDTAFKGLLYSCPNQTEGYSWPGDPTLCLVRYSNTSFSGSADLNPHVLGNDRDDFTSNLTDFKTVWEDLIGRTIAAASTARSTPSSSNNYYKAEVAALTKVKNIYALMQCTPDISPDDCKKCLQQSVMEYQSCCSQKQGGVVLQPSCYFRWDLYPYSKAFDDSIKVVASPPPVLVAVPKLAGDQANNNTKGISAGVVVAITVPTVVTVLILLVLGFVIFRKKKSGLLARWFAPRGKSHQEVDFNQTGITTVRSLQFKFKTIEAATNKFSESNKIGKGGFGDVFKGTLSDGKEIAVKRLSKTSEQSKKEFKNEVLVVAKLQHKNLVRLLGFSVKGKERIIVYELLPNKSLDYILFDPTRQGELDWTKRYKIIGGIARGILYLHQDSRLTVIHRDLKAGNILLDADMNPRIADFGTAKIFGMDQTRASTRRIVGTFGYMSPEYINEGQFSMKSDVYSFGVLVLEIICGKRTSSFSSAVQNLVTYAWSLWNSGSLLELVDPAIVENYQSEEVTRCIHIALLCVQDDPTDRPEFSIIMSMLTSNSLVLPVPQPPGLLVPQNNECKGSVSTMGPTSQSINDVTITSLDPR